MIDKKKVIVNATEKYAKHVAYVRRSAITSSKLSGESEVIIEAIVEAINTTDYEVEEQEEQTENEE